MSFQRWRFHCFTGPRLLTNKNSKQVSCQWNEILGRLQAGELSVKWNINSLHWKNTSYTFLLKYLPIWCRRLRGVGMETSRFKTRNPCDVRALQLRQLWPKNTVSCRIRLEPVKIPWSMQGWGNEKICDIDWISFSTEKDHKIVKMQTAARKHFFPFPALQRTLKLHASKPPPEIWKPPWCAKGSTLKNLGIQDQVTIQSSVEHIPTICQERTLTKYRSKTLRVMRHAVFFCFSRKSYRCKIYEKKRDLADCSS